MVCLRAKELTTTTAALDQGLSNDDVHVGGEQGIDDASEGSETTTEAAGGRQRALGIYDNDVGVGGGRWAQRLQRQQLRRRQRINDASKISETRIEAAAA